MTQAQKTAKAKFKQAIAYRTKTGVSLKEAFAHIYGKKKVAKKVVRKKAAKKRIAGPKDSAAVKRELARKGLKMPHGYTTTKRKRISGVKKKKITEKGILNRIHTVKRNVERLDEAQHKHMLGRIKAKPTVIALARKIARQTDMNEHQLAILSLAKFLKDKKSIELMNYVIKMHNNYGYMPNELYNISNDIYTKLMVLLKHKYGEIDYRLIKDSF
jgi:hypothetical protein